MNNVNRIIFSALAMIISSVGFSTEVVTYDLNAPKIQGQKSIQSPPVKEVESTTQEIGTEPVYPDHDLVERRPTSTQKSSLDFSESVDISNTQEFKSLLRDTEQTGEVRVIVGLALNYAPEGYLSKASVTAQKKELNDVQSAVINSLPRLAGEPEGKGYIRYSTIPYIALTAKKEELDSLSHNPNVVSIREDRMRMPLLDKSVPYIGGTDAFAMGFSGQGQTVAVLDNGFDKNHLFLQGKIVSEACYSDSQPSIGVVSLCPGGVTSSVAPGSAINCSPNIEACWHGTHVAGIVAGNAGQLGDGTPISGVAKDANLIAIQVFVGINNPTICGGQEPCLRTRDSLYIAGLERVFNLRSTYKIAAVNMSLGGGKYTSQGACDSENLPVKTAIDSLKSAGISTIVASGNDGYVDGIAAPACISSAISVGSTSATYGVPGANNS